MSYLTFSDQPSKSGKTREIGVFSSINSNFLGWVKWYGQWRRYTFYPIDGCVFDAACLKEIIAKIEELMAARKVTSAVVLAEPVFTEEDLSPAGKHTRPERRVPTVVCRNPCHTEWTQPMRCPDCGVIV